MLINTDRCICIFRERFIRSLCKDISDYHSSVPYVMYDKSSFSLRFFAVSLPGAGGEEPTILEVLNRNLISECDNEVTDQQRQQELQQPNEDHHIDDISHDEINDNIQLDIRYAASAQVTDLDVDDNENDRNRVFEFESHLIAEDEAAVAYETCGQVISEIEADPDTRTDDIVPDSEKTESAKCDIIPLDSSTVSESDKVDRRLPLIDSSTKRLSCVEERSNESESSHSDDNSKQTVVPEREESVDRPWYQDDDLDPEDQRIIQEAVESILKDAKQQLIDDQINLDSRQSEPVLLDDSPLQTPHLILSNPLFQKPLEPDSSPQVAQSLTPNTDNDIDTPSQYSPIPLQEQTLCEASSPDSGIASPEAKIGQPLLEPISPHNAPSPEPRSQTSLQSSNSHDSGVISPVQVETKNTKNGTSATNESDIDTNPTSLETKVNNLDFQEAIVTTTPTVHGPLPLEDQEQVISKEEETSHLVQDNQVQSESAGKETAKSLENSTDATHKPEEESEKSDKENLNKHTNLDSNLKTRPIDTDAVILSTEAKKEYYQRLREYLDDEELNRPPIPLKTYQWEDIRRLKEQVGTYILEYVSNVFRNNIEKWKENIFLDSF